MIVEATAEDFEAMISGIPPRDLRLSEDAVAPTAVLEMLGDLAQTIRPTFAPAAWMVVERGELVGLCSLVRPPVGDEIHIGYGIAPSCQDRGYAARAVADLLVWARRDPRVGAVTATSIDNPASRRVLERNGFVQTSERIDEEDGPVICWRIATA